MSVFTFSVARQGVLVPLASYTGNVILIVNTASRCSFTAANIEALNEVQRLSEPRGFTILAFPCAQFANQEPLSDSEITAWKDDMAITFPVFDKTNVKGKRADPLFSMLQERLGKAHWNYTKYLCDRSGNPVKRLDPTCFPSLLMDSVEALL